MAKDWSELVSVVKIRKIKSRSKLLDAVRFARKAKRQDVDTMDGATLYKFAAEVSKLEYPKVKIDGKEYYVVDFSK